MKPREPEKIATGLPGLDEILRGGLPARRTYLIRGPSGSGKTTLGLQFALEGVRRKEKVLYVMLTETGGELREVMASHGWSPRGLHVQESVEGPDILMKEAESTLFQPAELELGETVRSIVELVREQKPSRVVVDPLSELRVMAAEPMRFRMQFLALKQIFSEVGATALLLEESPYLSSACEHLENVAHGVIALEQHSPAYGPDRRRIRVEKIRGSRVHSGFHDSEIMTGGMVIYPRAIDLEKAAKPSFELLSTGLSKLDAMLGGGLEGGSKVLVLGQTGSGKSSLLAKLAHSLTSAGIKSSIFLFDESSSLFIRRSEGLGISLRPALQAGELSIVQVDPGEMSPGRLVHEVVTAVRSRRVGAVVLDSLDGLSRSMYDEPLFSVRLRELFAWLSRRGVTTLASLPRSGSSARGAELSYFADTIVLLRHWQRDLELQKSVTVLKRRGGEIEPSVRELILSPHGISIGERLRQPIWPPPPAPPLDGWTEKGGERSSSEEQRDAPS
ncbi:MAG: ATPase domain-containing protein [Myxococcota bacterium]